MANILGDFASDTRYRRTMRDSFVLRFSAVGNGSAMQGWDQFFCGASSRTPSSIMIPPEVSCTPSATRLRRFNHAPRPPAKIPSRTRKTTPMAAKMSPSKIIRAERCGSSAAKNCGRKETKNNATLGFSTFERNPCLKQVLNRKRVPSRSTVKAVRWRMS